MFDFSPGFAEGRFGGEVFKEFVEFRLTGTFQEITAEEDGRGKRRLKLAGL